MLEIRNLTKTYKTKAGEVNALCGVDIDLPGRGMVFILGRSGSGKSTLLNIIGGLDRPDGGDVVVGGESLCAMSEKELDKYRNLRVGFVFQEYNLIDSYSVGQNVSLALELQGRKVERSEIEEWLKRLELCDDAGRTFYDRKTSELSGGQKQRVAIARALIKDAEIILADEPTGALDSETGTELYELLSRLSSDRLVLIVTHDREAAEKYGDRVITIEDGNVISDETRRTSPPEPPHGGGSMTGAPSGGRGRLNFSQILPFGARAAVSKPFRLIVTMLMAIVSFSLFGFSFSAATADRVRCELRTMRDDGSEILMMTRSYYVDYGGDDGPNLISSLFTGDELALVREVTGKDAYRVTRYSELDTALYDCIDEDYELISKRRNPYINACRGPGIEVEIPANFDIADLRLSPDARFADPSLCRMPAAENEIAITDLRADIFIEYGYRAPDGSSVEINTPDDLIGLELGGKRITGVYSTEEDADFYRGFDIDNFGLTPQQILDYDISGVANGPNVEADYELMCRSYNGATILNAYFIAEREHDDMPGCIMFRLTGDLGKDTRLVKRLWQNYGGNLQSSVSNFTARAEFFFEFAFIGFIIAAVLAVFAVLLMMNYFSVSIDYRRRELCVLRALGAGGRDLSLVCVTESLITSFAQLALSCAGTAVICALINSAYMVSLYTLGAASIAALFGVCVLTAALSALLPALRMAGKRPVELLQGR